MPSSRNILPEYIEGPGGLVVRRWAPDDAEALARAVAESAEHLRPWMAWTTHVEIHNDKANEASAGVQWPTELPFAAGAAASGEKLGVPGLGGRSGRCRSWMGRLRRRPWDRAAPSGSDRWPGRDPPRPRWPVR